MKSHILIRLPIDTKGKNCMFCDDDCPHLRRAECFCRLFGKLYLNKGALARDEACLEKEDASYHFASLYDKVSG